jgi:hypothetical protein
MGVMVMRWRLGLLALLLGCSSGALLAQEASPRTEPGTTAPTVRKLEPSRRLPPRAPVQAVERTPVQSDAPSVPPPRVVRERLPTSAHEPMPARPGPSEIDRLNPQPDPPMTDRVQRAAPAAGRVPGRLLLSAERMLALKPAALRTLTRAISNAPRAADLQLWDGLDAPPSEFFRTVDGPVSADRSRTSLKWYFRYTARMPAASALYQVSVFPFPDSEKDPLKPPGLIAQGAITAIATPGHLALFTVDFKPHARPRPSVQLDQPMNPAVVAGATGAASSPQLALTPETIRADRRAERMRTPPSGLARELRLPPQRLRILHTGYYVRVVLKNAAGKVSGRPSRAVHLSFDEPTPGSPIEILMGTHPEVGFADYRAVRPDNWAQLCIRRYTGPPLPFFATGAIGDICADDDSFLDALGDALGDVVGALAGLYEQVVAVYEWAKTQAVALAASAIEGLGLPCPCPIGSCSVCLEAALDYGLASLGIPPTLPSFDQLVNEGVDYLAATIAAETGLPIAEAMEVARTLADQSASGGTVGGAGAPLLWMPLEEHLYAPLVLKLRVGPSRWPVNLVIDNPDGRYERAMVPIPAVDRELLVPIALVPSEAFGAWKEMLPTMDSLPAPNLLANWMRAWAEQMQAATGELLRWQKRYTQGTVELRVSTLSAAGSGYTTQQQLQLHCPAGGGQCSQ